MQSAEHTMHSADYALCTLCIMYIMHYAYYGLCTWCIMHIVYYAHYALCYPNPAPVGSDPAPVQNGSRIDGLAPTIQNVLSFLKSESGKGPKMTPNDPAPR